MKRQEGGKGEREKRERGRKGEREKRREGDGRISWKASANKGTRGSDWN